MATRDIIYIGICLNIVFLFLSYFLTILKIVCTKEYTNRFISFTALSTIYGISITRTKPSFILLYASLILFPFYYTGIKLIYILTLLTTPCVETAYITSNKYKILKLVEIGEQDVDHNR